MNNGIRTYIDSEYVERASIETSNVSIASSPYASSCERGRT